MQRFGNIFSARANSWEVFGRNQASGLGLAKKNGIFSGRYHGTQSVSALGNISPTFGGGSGEDRGVERQDLQKLC